MIVSGGRRGPRTLFSPEQFSRDKRGRVLELMYAPGDGSATRQSLFGQPPGRPAADAVAPSMRSPSVWTAFFCDGHASLPLNPTLQNNLLTALLVNDR